MSNENQTMYIRIDVFAYIASSGIALRILLKNE